MKFVGAEGENVTQVTSMWGGFSAKPRSELRFPPSRHPCENFFQKLISTTNNKYKSRTKSFLYLSSVPEMSWLVLVLMRRRRQIPAPPKIPKR